MKILIAGKNRRLAFFHELFEELKENKNEIFYLGKINLFSIYKLFYYKLKYKIEYVFLFNKRGKIYLTFGAKIFGIEPVWIEVPGADKSAWRFYRWFSKYAIIICLNNHIRDKISSFCHPNARMEIMAPGIRAKNLFQQENLFSKLAHVQYDKSEKKYFTVGTILLENDETNIETLFRAIEKSLLIIPNLQLIVMSDASQKEKLSWLAEKLGIKNNIWLVGDHINYRKWLSGFDVLIISSDKINIDNYMLIIQSLAYGLPIIAQKYTGLDDLIADNETGILLEQNNSENISNAIIRLEHDQSFKHWLEENGRIMIKKNYLMEKTILRLNEILKPN